MGQFAEARGTNDPVVMFGNALATIELSTPRTPCDGLTPKMIKTALQAKLGHAALKSRPRRCLFACRVSNTRNSRRPGLVNSLGAAGACCGWRKADFTSFALFQGLFQFNCKPTLSLKDVRAQASQNPSGLAKALQW